MNYARSRATLDKAASERILIIDGAMGTMIQRHKPTEETYRGRRFAQWGQDVKGNNELLSLTQPEMIEGIQLFSVLNKKAARGTTVKLSGPGTPPPEPEFTLGGRRPTSQFAFPVPREPVFGSDDEAPLPDISEGWLGRPGDAWFGWWRRLDKTRAVVFVIRGSEIMNESVESALVLSEKPVLDYTNVETGLPPILEFYNSLEVAEEVG